MSLSSPKSSSDLSASQDAAGANQSAAYAACQIPSVNMH
jgi:hypothetical protein